MRLILGTMNMGPQDPIGLMQTRIPEQADVEAILSEFEGLSTPEVECNEIDTARVYLSGNTEQTLGRAGVCAKFTVGTKVFPVPQGFGSAIGISEDAKGLEETSVREQVHESLAALQTDCVDVLYLHWPDPATPLEATLAIIDGLHKSGTFRELGLSNFPAFQYPYNPLARTIENEMMPVCRHYGIRMYTYNPLAGGMLAGKYTITGEIPKGRFSGDGSQATRYRERYWNRQFIGALEEIRIATEAEGLSMAGATLRWMAHHSSLESAEGDALIIGCSSVAQLRESVLGARGGPLSQAVLDAFQRGYEMVHGSEIYYSRTGDGMARWGEAPAKSRL